MHYQGYIPTVNLNIDNALSRVQSDSQLDLRQYIIMWKYDIMIDLTLDNA